MMQLVGLLVIILVIPTCVGIMFLWFDYPFDVVQECTALVEFIFTIAAIIFLVRT